MAKIKRVNRDHLFEEITIYDFDGVRPLGTYKAIKHNIKFLDHLTKTERKVFERLEPHYQLSICLSTNPFNAFYDYVEQLSKKVTDTSN